MLDIKTIPVFQCADTPFGRIRFFWSGGVLWFEAYSILSILGVKREDAGQFVFDHVSFADCIVAKAEDFGGSEIAVTMFGVGQILGSKDIGPNGRVLPC